MQGGFVNLLSPKPLTNDRFSGFPPIFFFEMNSYQNDFPRRRSVARYLDELFFRRFGGSPTHHKSLVIPNSIFCSPREARVFKKYTEI